MKIEHAIATIKRLLYERHGILVSQLVEEFPDVSISQFGHRHCDEVYSMGISARPTGDKARCVSLCLNVLFFDGTKSARAFVSWDETYSGSDGHRHTCVDAASSPFSDLNDEKLRGIVEQTIQLEKVFRTSLKRGSPLNPSPLIV